jgi:hypothetical protein
VHSVPSATSQTRLRSDKPQRSGSPHWPEVMPYVVRVSDPMTAFERLQLAAAHAAGQPIAVVPLLSNDGRIDPALRHAVGLLKDSRWPTPGRTAASRVDAYSEALSSRCRAVAPRASLALVRCCNQKPAT